MNEMSPNPTMTEEAPAQDTSPQSLVSEINIAKRLKEKELNEIGTECKEGFDADYNSRDKWEADLEEWTKLAMQVRERKSFPWTNASNVKYPLLSTASMQFNARAYPSLIPSDGKVVKGKTIGKDLTGAKGDKADRVATYMSYQFMHEMQGWDEDMDKLLMMLPIVGTLFKKTYWDGGTKEIKSCLVLPKNLVVNNWAKDLESAERVSEVIQMSQRKYEEKIRQGVYLDVDLGEPSVENILNDERNIGVVDATTPYIFVEQHTYLDLDDDGLAEPYIVTFELRSGKVVRIAARYEPEGIQLNDKGKIAGIEPVQYYTKYSFVPNPDGSFYDIGFGVLLGPLNESVNTLINQLVDAGTLSNMQSGFIGKGLRIKMGDNRFQPGEWKPVASTGSDLKNQIVPLPAKEPSDVLFQLMGSLISSGKELASVAEIFVGKMPGQNTPATTTMATIEQGMKVFTAVYKRIYRALDKEFKKVYLLNSIYLDPENYTKVLDLPADRSDFDPENYDICPGADPSAMSSTEKLLKAQGLMELLPSGALDPIEVIKRILQAQEQPNWESLFTKEVQASGQLQQQPDPKQMEMQMKMQMEQQKAQLSQQQAAFKAQMDASAQETKNQMAQMAQAQEARHKESMAIMDAGIAEHKQKIFMAQGAQKLQQNAETHQQKLQQMKETAKLQSQNKTKPTGKAAK